MDDADARPMTAPPVDMYRLHRQPLVLVPLKSPEQSGAANHTGAAPPAQLSNGRGRQDPPYPASAQRQEQQPQAAAQHEFKQKRQLSEKARGTDKTSMMRAYLEEQWETLNDDDKAELRRSFEIMDAAPQSNAVGVFINLLSEYPPYKKLWPQFRNIPDSALMGATEIRTHAKVFMDGTRLIIENMDNMDELERHFLRIAATHKRKAVKKQQIDDMLVAMLDSLRQVLGSDYTKEVDAAWSKLFNVFGNVVEHYKVSHKWASLRFDRSPSQPQPSDADRQQ